MRLATLYPLFPSLWVMKGQRPDIADIQVRILGPIEAYIGGEKIRFGPQQLALFTLLLLASGMVVPSSRLTVLLWGEPPPSGAPATLRAHIFNLRRLLRKAGREAFLVGGGTGRAAGYALEIPPLCVDAARFERGYLLGREAMRQRQPQEAARLLDDGLALWRGQALADVADRPFALEESTRLSELRRAAWLLRTEANLALGRHDVLVAELAAALARQPRDERVRTLLVVALTSCDRGEEAAEVCRVGLQLAYDNGLEPASLRYLQARVLRGETINLPGGQ